MQTASETKMYSNRKLCISLVWCVCLCMVENCLLNNNNILCSISLSAKFSMYKRRHEGDWGDIYLIECVFTILSFFCSLTRQTYEKKHCKFTYNNAHTLIRTRLNSQLFTYLIPHFFISLLVEFYFYFIYEISLLFVFIQWIASTLPCVILRSGDGTCDGNEKFP